MDQVHLARDIRCSGSAWGSDVHSAHKLEDKDILGQSLQRPHAEVKKPHRRPTFHGIEETIT